MKKFLVIVLLLGAAFGAGYYVGRQPPEEVKRQIRELSQEVVEQMTGFGEDDLKNFYKPSQGFGRQGQHSGRHPW